MNRNIITVKQLYLNLFVFTLVCVIAPCNCLCVCSADSHPHISTKPYYITYNMKAIDIPTFTFHFV